MEKVSWKDIGLVNTREMFKKAMAGKHAIPAYNCNNMEQPQTIALGCVKSKSPFILQVSSGASKCANQTLLRFLAMGAVAMIKDANSTVKFSLHLDHGDTFELCKSCIDSGLSSVMIDGSHHSYEDNIKVTKQVMEYARQYNVTVEGELGVLAGIEDAVVADKSTYTKPEQVEDFVKKTGVDSLAISIGTSHGAMKFKPEQCTRDSRGVLVPLPLRFDILEEIEKRIPGFPIVLRASSVIPEYIQIINSNGGKLKDADHAEKLTYTKSNNGEVFSQKSIGRYYELSSGMSYKVFKRSQYILIGWTMHISSPRHEIYKKLKHSNTSNEWHCGWGVRP